MVMRIKHLLVVGVLLAMSSTSFAYTPTMCYLPKGDFDDYDEYECIQDFFAGTSG